MVVTPQSNLRLLSNVKLNPSYVHTYDPANAGSQLSNFSALTFKTFANFTYIRDSGRVRVEGSKDSLLPCNYMMYQNTAYGSKWFYAFITDLIYINDNCTEIEFEQDVMQTWYFEMNVMPCFVEREHTNNDTIGSNLIEENVQLGEYVAGGASQTGFFSQNSIIIASSASTVNEAVVDTAGAMYGPLYSGVIYHRFPNAATANSFIEKLTAAGKQNSVLNIFMFPTQFWTQPDNDYSPVTREISITKKTDNINGYIPKNNKLFTYPYNFLYVTNLNGNSATYRYEYFSTPNCPFKVIMSLSSVPEAECVPGNYKNIVDNWNEALSLSGWPQCSYTSDSYKAWLAQNASGNIIGVIGSAVTTGAGLATGNIPVIAGGLIGAANAINERYKASIQPDQTKGVQTSSVNFVYGVLDFVFIKYQIDAQHAKMIDDFFSMFGYATNQVKTPNIKGRRTWNYVKTIDANISGNIPGKDLIRIKQCFNDGITFWHDLVSIGLYNLPNGVI